MSRTADRLARVQRRLEQLDRVMLVVLREVGEAGQDCLLYALGGTPRARAAAVAKFYAERPDLTPTKQHVATMKSGGIAWRPRSARRAAPRRQEKRL